MSLWQMSLSGGIIIMLIMLVRSILINKLPKRTFVFLWKVALLRLLIPFSIPCTLSIVSPYDVGIPGKDAPFLESAGEFLKVYESATIEVPSQNLQVFSGHAEVPWKMIWFFGFLTCITIYVVCYGNCLRNFNTALPVTSDYIQSRIKEHSIKRTISIRQYDRISSPLTYGIFRPVILFPKNTDLNNHQQINFVLEHEFVHICSFDLLTKMVAAITLCIHWFNPMVWGLYIFLSRDLELACDEVVIRTFDKTSRANYARALIALEERRSLSARLFSNFSKNIMKERIVAIMKPKKYSRYAVLGTIMLVLLATTSFLTVTQATEKHHEDNKNDNFTEIVLEDTANSAVPENIVNETEEAVAFSMVWPTESSVISLEYGEIANPATGEKMLVDHICIKGDRGDEIYAAISGTVVEATYSPDRGNHIILTNEAGVTTIYGHMDSISVSVGDVVAAGDAIGTLGATGYATGPNLSFGVTDNRNPVDPMNYFE